MNSAAGPRPALLVFALIGTFIGTFSASSVSVALPDIGSDLALSFTASLWVSTLYLVFVAVLLLPFGRLADARGHARCYLAGIAFICAGSLVAGLAQDAALLLAGRAVQGIGGALVAATASALVVAAFAPDQRGRALGWNVMAVYLGFSLGPTLGGFILEHLGWRALFLVNLPLALAALAGGLRLGLLAADVHRGELRLDTAGILTLAASLSAAVVALTFAPLWGPLAPATVALVVLAAVSLAAFVAAERRARPALLDLSLLRNRAFAVGNAGALVSSVALFGLAPIIAVFLRVAQGRSAQLTGLVLLAQPLMMTLFSPLSGRLADRVDGRRMMALGMLVVAAGLIVAALAPGDMPIWWLAGCLAVVGLGAACFSLPNNSVVYGAVDRSQLGFAAGVIGTTRYVGQALSLALLGGLVVTQIGSAGAALLYAPGAGGVSDENLTDALRLALGAAAAFALLTALVSAGVPRRAPAAAVTGSGA